MNPIAKKKAKKAPAAGKIAKNKTREFAVETLKRPASRDALRFLEKHCGKIKAIVFLFNPDSRVGSDIASLLPPDFIRDYS